ncbi:hypothetical protein RB594_006740 [Gaeumannomyces avenae]
MNGLPNQEDRRWRLLSLAKEWKIPTGALPSAARPPEPPPWPEPPGPNDDFMAEELLKRHRLATDPAQSPQGGRRLSFMGSSKKKSWDLSEISETLDAHVSAAGPPAVAHALIKKLQAGGGNVNVSVPKGKTTLLNRRKSLGSSERSRVLQRAVQNQQADMVAVLVQYADPLTLDAALPMAIRSGNQAIIQSLLAHGASISQTSEGLEIFRQLSAAGGQADMVARLLASNGRPPPVTVSQAMVAATQKGCLDTVLQLSRSTADGNYDGGAALKTAIAQCRGDICLAILTGAKPPAGPCLSEAFAQLFSHPTIIPNEKLALAEMLLCAGTEGDAVSEALIQAAATEFFDMVQLLIEYGASVEYEYAKVLRTAIAHGRASLVPLLLNDTTTLSPACASECVLKIPRRITSEERCTLLSALLRKGAGGPPLSEALIAAAEDVDAESVKLLLSPYFPGDPGRLEPEHDVRRGPRGLIRDKHDVASVDHKGGQALRLAVMTRSVAVVKLILSAGPLAETLTAVFPTVMTLPPIERYQIAKLFLSAGVRGSCVSQALQGAIEEHPPKRDERFISLLLQHDADVNFNSGAGIISAVAHEDVPLLKTLLQSQPSPQTTVTAVSKAMLSADVDTRFKMISALLANYTPILLSNEIAEALIIALQENPVDKELVEVLIKQGCANINFNSSAPFILAVRQPEFEVVDLMLRVGKPTQETLERGLHKSAGLPSTPDKARKMEAILARMEKKGSATGLLVAEVTAVVNTPPEQRAFSGVKALLKAGADVNFQKGRCLCVAIKGRDTQLVDIIFAARPSPESMATAMPCAVNITDPMDRLAFTQKLLEAGAPAKEANRALVHAVKDRTDDLPLINLLAGKADSTDGEALTLAIKRERPDIVELVLIKTPTKYDVAVLNDLLTEAMQMKNLDMRKGVCQMLLHAGASGLAASEALLVAASTGDVMLVSTLVYAGASIEHKEGQAVVEACRSGSHEVLKILLSSPATIEKQTLLRGFQASTSIADLQKRCAVFRLLLEKGVTGEVVDAELVSAVKYGDKGINLVRLLLKWGCSLDHNRGEAIWTATRSAFLGSLRIMLGLEDVGRKQKRPSHTTMIQSLKASWRLAAGPRYEVIEMLFEAGLPVGEDVEVGLTKAVNDEEHVDLKLVRLLLEKGASPTTNACRALCDATQKLLRPVVDLFLEREISPEDLSWTFAQAFSPASTHIWLSEDGLEVAKCFLGKGARGDGISSALASAIDAYGSERDGIARQFAELLLASGADVSFDSGQALQMAARAGDVELIQQLLEQKPTPQAVSMALPHVFDLQLPEDKALELVSLFAQFRNGEVGLDVVTVQPDSEPVVFKALDRYPRSTKMVQTLLDAGYYFDRMTTARVADDAEEEQVSLLLWALLQPQKRISSAVILQLIENGAKVDFETSETKTTPLMVAVRNKRLDLVRALILADPEVVNITDTTGNTALTLATQIGGEVGTTMMTSILAAEPSKDDGSLHNAARELDVRAMQVLAEFGHDIDFPSPLHGGRSALGEICLHAADIPLTPAREKAMEKAMAFLIEQGTDPSIRLEEKSVLLLALESQEPVTTARALLKVGMWKHINKPFNNYTDGRFTYSPTEYVARVMTSARLGGEANREQLLALLKANRAASVFYANDGPQPEGAQGLPDELLRAERERRARAERQRLEREDHQGVLVRTDEMAALQNRIAEEKAAVENARDRRRRADKLEAMREWTAAEEEAFARRVAAQRAEREAALDHARLAAESELEKARLLADTEVDAEARKQRRQIEYRKALGEEQVAAERNLSAVRAAERDELAYHEERSDGRARARIAQQRALVDSQAALAASLGNAGVTGRRQVGYITGELD